LFELGLDALRGEFEFSIDRAEKGVFVNDVKSDRVSSLYEQQASFLYLHTLPVPISPSIPTNTQKSLDETVKHILCKFIRLHVHPP
jgi:hypothetical protein